MSQNISSASYVSKYDASIGCADDTLSFSSLRDLFEFDYDFNLAIRKQALYFEGGVAKEMRTDRTSSSSISSPLLDPFECILPNRAAV